MPDYEVKEGALTIDAVVFLERTEVLRATEREMTLTDVKTEIQALYNRKDGVLSELASINAQLETLIATGKLLRAMALDHVIVPVVKVVQ